MLRCARIAAASAVTRDRGLARACTVRAALVNVPGSRWKFLLTSLAFTGELVAASNDIIWRAIIVVVAVCLLMVVV